MLSLLAASKVPSPFVVTYFLLSSFVMIPDDAYTPMASFSDHVLPTVARVTVLDMSACTVAATGPLLSIPSSSFAQAASSKATAAMYKILNFFINIVF